MTYLWSQWGDQRLLVPQAAAPQTYQLDKRSPPRKIGPLVITAGCLGCKEAQTPGREASLDTLTVPYLMQTTRVPRSELRDKCLFYTSITPAGKEQADVPAESRDFPRAQKLRPFGVLGKTPWGLSKHAARYACDNGLLTLWVSTSTYYLPNIYSAYSCLEIPT